MRTKRADGEALLSEPDAARLLGVKAETLRLWRRQGRAPAHVRLGRLVRYRSSDVVRFIETKVRTCTPSAVATTVVAESPRERRRR